MKDFMKLAAMGAIGARPGLVVRVRPATQFELSTWEHCPPDALRVIVDEDGRASENIPIESDLPKPLFVSRKEWRQRIQESLRRAGR